MTTKTSPEKEKRVLELREEGLTAAEIGERLGMTSRAVRKVTAREKRSSFSDASAGTAGTSPLPRSAKRR